METLLSEFAELDQQLTTKYEELVAEANELLVPSLFTYYAGAIEHAHQMPYEAACELVEGIT